LAGHTLPLVFAIFAVPVLTRQLGIDRFGVLALAWTVIGYFSLFDLGLGRALTKLVSEKLGAKEPGQIPEIVRTALVLMLMLGIVGMVSAAALSPWLVYTALNVPEGIKEETLSSFYLLSFSIPIVILTAGLRGILEAYQKFEVVNIIRGTLGAFTFFGPLLVLPFSHSLIPVVAVLLAGRIVALLIHFSLCWATLPSTGGQRFFDGALARPLVRQGSWMTVSNVIGPLMVYVDRFLIGVFVSMAAVAYYVTPYEVVTKLWVIPGALAAVLFPTFAAQLSGDQWRTVRLYSGALKSLLIMILPLCLVMVTFAGEGFELWLGSEFAMHSTSVLQWLTVGVFVNSIAQIPFALVQSAGRADVTARLHLLELPFYLLLLWVLLKEFGVAGAAAAWALRATLDMLLLLRLAKNLVPEPLPEHVSFGVACIIALMLLLLGSLLPPVAWLKLILVTVCCGLFVLGAWRFVLNESERGYFLDFAKTICTGIKLSHG
jgi:O-antigen/teichoic acid export membrane protein